MTLFAFGINHHTAPLSVREQVVFHVESMAQALRDLVDHRPVQEAAIIGLQKRDQFTEGTSFTAWMGQMVRNVSLNVFRREKRRRSVSIARRVASHRSTAPQLATVAPRSRSIASANTS